VDLEDGSRIGIRRVFGKSGNNSPLRAPSKMVAGEGPGVRAWEPKHGVILGRLLGPKRTMPARPRKRLGDGFSRR